MVKNLQLLMLCQVYLRDLYVLGPLLFLLYINDSVQEPLSDGTLISLYADDILMYRINNCIQDHEMLQNDTNTVSIIIMG